MRHYSSSERMHRLSVIYAMVGLLLGCLSAGLIVASARRLSRPPVVDITWMEQVEPRSTVTMASRQLRAHRRLTDDAVRTRKTFTDFERTLASIPSPVIPTANPPSSPPPPTLAPTSKPVDTNVQATKVSSEESTTSTVATETVAAAMVGVASSLIVCALLCYASDVRDRYRHEKWVTEQRDQDVVDDNSTQKSVYRSRVEGESLTSAGSTHQESGYTYRVQVTNELVKYQGNSQIILPPLLVDEVECDENFLALTLPEYNSISRISTLTASFVEGGFSFNGSFSAYDDMEEKLSHRCIESSEKVTELSDSHRVSDDTPLASLIKCDASNCSSLTNGSHSAVLLLGEECLDIKFHQTPDTRPVSLEVSPDTPFVDDDGVMSGNDAGVLSGEKLIDESDELAQLDQIIAGIPFDEMSNYTPMHDDVEGRNDVEDTREEGEESSRVVFIRQVCFVPCATVSFGLELHDASSAETYPTVSTVDLSGPLVGRVFIGDGILAINDHETCGLCSEQIMKLFESEDPASEHGTKMITLTVMSSESDGGSLSDEQQSIDLDSAVEV